MRSKQDNLGAAVRLALCVGAVGLVGSGLATAQDETTELDLITVTGTRLSSPGIVANSPISSFTAEELAIKQIVTVEDFLRELPTLVPAIGPGTNNGSGGGATIDLRGLGANRTLVLVNGRRVVPFNLGGVVDTNNIPVALIERVDIVTGGASAVYGADAVSGVVNFILKKNFEGAELAVQWGQSSESDGDRQRMDVTIGGNFAEGRGNAVVSIGHTKTDPVLQGSRPFGLVSRSSTDGTASGSPTGLPTTINIAGIGNRGLCANGSLAASCVGSFNFNPLNLFQTPLDRVQANALSSFAITDDHEAYSELMFTRSDVRTQLAASPAGGVPVSLPIGNPFLPNAARQQICTERNIPAAQCVVGSTTLVPVTIGRRLVELGPRLNDFENKTFQGTVGVRGYLTDAWKYDAYYSFGEADQTTTRGNWGSRSRFIQALGATNTTTCTNTANGCVPLDIFSGAPITPAMLRFINLDTLSTQFVKQDVLAGNVSGDLGEGLQSPWAAYPIAVSAGIEQRELAAGTKSDQASQIQSEVIGTGAPTPDRRGTFELLEGYAEVIAPIINDAPGAYSLSFEGGFRRSRFETAGSSTSYNTYKYGGEWAPIESLRFRALQQRATRAPNVNELFAPQVTGLSNLAVDPCAGRTPTASQALCALSGVPSGSFGTVDQPAAGQVNVLTGGNPQLQPEEADTRTLGFVWTPGFIENLSVTLDYYKIDIEKYVSNPTVADIVNACYGLAGIPQSNVACGLVQRDPRTGNLNGEARGIVLASSNLGRLETDGYDLGVTYLQDLGDIGALDFGLNLTKVRSWNFQANPASVNRDCNGYYSTSCSPLHDFKSVFRAGWSMGDLGVNLIWRHLTGLDVEPGTGTWFAPYASIPSYNYFDLGARYQVTENIRLNLSISNLTDKAPPEVGNTIGSTTENSGNTFPQFYDTIGRFYTLGVNVSF
ncbi:TonB-dependent receptor domain-containing protein [Aquimonas sp.]|jgi:iron complex outermembrane receptor protein|uniref:TonB-dependent receptor plug domain-containing protein n=1 Tax=Aquimonas sp. TaxID=1872588 RepID=UPI0037BF4818